MGIKERLRQNPTGEEHRGLLELAEEKVGEEGVRCSRLSGTFLVTIASCVLIRKRPRGRERVGIKVRPEELLGQNPPARHVF